MEHWLCPLLLDARSEGPLSTSPHTVHKCSAWAGMCGRALPVDYETGERGPTFYS